MATTLLQLLGGTLLFVLPNLGLGWWLARLTSLAPIEKTWLALVTGIVASGLWVFLAYALQAPVAANWVPSLLGLLLFIGAQRGLRHQSWSRSDFTVLSATGVTAVVVLAALSWIRHYSGGGWAADWLEHLQRAQLFAQHGPADTRFFDFYTLPARPPLWNAYIGQVFTVLGSSFLQNQLQVALSAALLLPPLWALVRRVGGGDRAGWTLTLLVALNPSFLQNATFGWTRAPTVALILGGILCFLRSRDATASARPLRLLAFGLLAAACLMHYSAGPWLVALVGLHLWERRRHWRDAATWRELGILAGIGLLLLGPWLLWSTLTFGADGTASATTTMMAANQTGAWLQLGIIVANTFDTIVPWFMRVPWSAWEARPESWMGNLHDMTFILYQANLWFCIGTVGGLALVVHGWRHRRAWTAERATWAALLVVGGGVGIAVNGFREIWGISHICLQPVIYLALVGIAAHLDTWSRGWQRAFWVGWSVDVSLGTLLHLAIESRDLLPFVSTLSRAAFRAEFGPAAHANLYYKVTSLSLFWGDEFFFLRPFTALLALVAVGWIIHRRRTA